MGIPTVLIQHGKLIEENMKKVKFDVNDLLEECRGNGYFDISEIEFALMEANGKLSILPNGENKPLTIKDMALKPKKQGLCANLVIDGKIMSKTLETIHKTSEWLEKEIHNKGKRLEDILLATLDVDDKLVIYEKHVKDEILDVLE